MANFYVDSNTSSIWVASAAQVLGDRRVPTRAYATAAAKGFVYEVTTAGTNAATEPTWPTTDAGTVTDGTTVWTARIPSTTANASAFLDYVHNNRAAAGDTIFVRTTHNEANGVADISYSAIGTAALPVSWLCAGTWVDNPTTLGVGAIIATTGTGDLVLYGFGVLDGINLVAGDSTGAGSISFFNTVTRGGWVVKNSVLELRGTAATAFMSFGMSSSATKEDQIVSLENTQVKFSNVGQLIRVRGKLTWRNTPTAILGTVPTTLLVSSVGLVTDATIVGVDFSAVAAGKNLIDVSAATTAAYSIRNCIMGAGNLTTGTIPGPGGAEVIADNVVSTAINYGQYYQDYTGTRLHESTIVKTGGQTDGTTALSVKMSSSADTRFSLPLSSPWLPVWIDTTAVAKTITIDIIHDVATAITDKEAWIEVDFFGSATTPISSTVSDSAASILAAATNQEASTAAWDGATIAARANSTAYVVGNIYKVGTNAGRIFFCTVAGTSAAAEPAGLATAVDGGEVVDGTATFRAAMRQKLTSPAFTTQMKGYAMARVRLAKPSHVIYADCDPQVA